MSLNNPVKPRVSSFEPEKNNSTFLPCVVRLGQGETPYFHSRHPRRHSDDYDVRGTRTNACLLHSLHPPAHFVNKPLLRGEAVALAHPLAPFVNKPLLGGEAVE